MIYYKEEHEFYNGIEGLIDYLCEYEPDEKALAILREKCPNGLTVQECELQPIKTFTQEELKQVMFDSIDNWPEDAESSENKVEKAIDKFLMQIDLFLMFLNRSMPELWYPTDEKTHYSLKQLEEML